jgi:hypothetical protein
MGKLTGGILGPVKGKVGAIVGSVVGGQNVVKQMPASYNDKKSTQQLDQRTAFKNTLEWYQALNGAVNIGFVEKQAKHSSYNAFMSDNVNNGVGKAAVDWNKLNVSKGSLVNPNILMETSSITNQLDFSWSDDTDGSNKLATDKVVLTVIEPLSKEVLVVSDAVTRADESHTLTIPATMVGKELQTYAFIVRADGKKASTSLRTGKGVAGSDLAGSVQ